MPRLKTNRIDLRLDDEFLARIETWRHSQPGPPSLTASVLHLINVGLEDERVRAAAPARRRRTAAKK
jgi:hypothetical protein